MPEILLTDGARRLRSYLLAIQQSVPDFCEKHGIPRQKAQRVLAGSQRAVTVDFAIAIADATGGAVPVEAWSCRTLKPAKPGEVGRLFSRRGTTVEAARTASSVRAAPPKRARQGMATARAAS